MKTCFIEMLKSLIPQIEIMYPISGLLCNFCQFMSFYKKMQLNSIFLIQMAQFVAITLSFSRGKIIFGAETGSYSLFQLQKGQIQGPVFNWLPWYEIHVCLWPIMLPHQFKHFHWFGHGRLIRLWFRQVWSLLEGKQVNVLSKEQLLWKKW